MRIKGKQLPKKQSASNRSLIFRIANKFCFVHESETFCEVFMTIILSFFILKELSEDIYYIILEICLISRLVSKILKTSQKGIDVR